MKNAFLLIVTVILSLNVFSQDCFCGKSNISEAGIKDGPAILEHVATKRMVAYEYVREADVIWSKKVWSSIDVREKINQPLYYPLDEITASGAWIQNNQRVSLWSIIRCNVFAGNLTIFSPYNANNLFGNRDGDQMKYPVQPTPGRNYYTDSAYREELLYYFGKLGPQKDVPLTDPYGDPLIQIINGVKTYVYEPRDTIWYTSKDIIQYRIKEDWFIDKERSKIDVRITAIAPVVLDYEMDANGNKTIIGTKELFWLYFPHCRYIFNNYLLYNEQNDSQMMSFDDLFHKRRFSSTIYKESNVYDRDIETYAHGVDALLESERIKEKIRTLESDVWSF
jgi:gliding motility associated protien GldN